MKCMKKIAAVTGNFDKHIVCIIEPIARYNIAFAEKIYRSTSLKMARVSLGVHKIVFELTNYVVASHDSDLFPAHAKVD